MPILISATMDFDPPSLDTLIARFRPLIEAVRIEPGCEAYSWAIDPFVPGRVHIFERWQDEASLATRFRQPGYFEMRDLLTRHPPQSGISRKYRVDRHEPLSDEAGTPRADFLSE